MPKAVSYLASVQKTLDAYASTAVPTSEAAPAPAASTAPAEPEAQP
jgi:hypothetical protein